VAVGDQAGEEQRLATRIESLEAGLAERDAKLAERDAKLAERDAKLAELVEVVAKLTSQIEKLTEQLGQNSKNSHRPPSSDGPGAGSRGGASGQRRPGTGRKRGGQKGHRGSHRELLPAARVNEFVDLFPAVCLGCARPLQKVLDAAACRHQQLDLRDHRPHLTEFRRHELQCEHCGMWTRAAYARGQIPASAFGPCLTAVVGMLTGAYHLSRRSAQKLLLELFGISISLGAISGMEARASEALKSAYAEAEREVQYAGIKHTDATSWTRAGKLMSLWTLASVAATVYRIFADGCRATIRPLFGPAKGILVSDRAGVFMFWSMALRQICFAHLVRKFVAFSERAGPAGALGCELLEYTALVFEYWHGYKDGILTRQELEYWLRPVRRGLERALECGEKANIERLSGACADILEHRDALWTFVTHEGVPPTNNHAELELRAFVMWRKRSFGSQSERGERFAERMMTVVHTARKQGKTVLDFLVRALTAHINGTMAPQLLGEHAPA
jgi:transposase